MGAHPKEALEALISPELDELRILTEVQHFLDHMDENGDVAPAVLEELRPNFLTATKESAMPGAVTKVEQQFEYYVDEQSTRQRMITWLGKSVVANTERGKEFHWSPAAHSRVDVEVAAARHEQATLRPGRVQAFISPKMSRHDASLEVAKSEHLHADDSVRTSTAITNEHGEMVGRLLTSLLVRDIPLSAWIAMLQDENNIFGQALPIQYPESARSVMELFADMELDETKLPEGPVTLVAAVLPYIKNNEQYDSVVTQLAGYRLDQAQYDRVAEQTTDEWMAFDRELALSIRAGRTTSDVQAFIIGLEYEWDDHALAIINNHALGNAEYVMTNQLAAVLERAQRNLLTVRAAILAGNQDVIDQAYTSGNQQLVINIQATELMYMNGLLSQQEYERQQSKQSRNIAQANLSSDRGCPGSTAANFRNSDSGENSEMSSYEAAGSQQQTTDRFGALNFKCPKGHQNTRPKNIVIPKCKVCGISVSCKPEDKKPAKQKLAQEKQVTAEAKIATQVDAVFAELDIAAIEQEELRRKKGQKELASLALARAGAAA